MEACTVLLHDEFPNIGSGFRTMLHYRDEEVGGLHSLFYIPLLTLIEGLGDEQMRTISRHSFNGWNLPDTELLLALIERTRYERQKAGASFDREAVDKVIRRIKATIPEKTPAAPVRVRTRRAA